MFLFAHFCHLPAFPTHFPHTSHTLTMDVFSIPLSDIDQYYDGKYAYSSISILKNSKFIDIEITKYGNHVILFHPNDQHDKYIITRFHKEDICVKEVLDLLDLIDPAVSILGAALNEIEYYHIVFDNNCKHTEEFHIR